MNVRFCNDTTRLKLILLTKRIWPLSDNLGEYSCFLAEELQALSYNTEVWALDGDRPDPPAVPVRSFKRRYVGATQLATVLLALKQSSPAVLMWQYNPFSYGWSGFPGPICLMPILTKLYTDCRVILVFHEINVDNLPDIKYKLRFYWQRACLWFILQGTDVAITTNVVREQALKRFVARWIPWRINALDFATIPVGPLIPKASVVPPKAGSYGAIRVGAFVANLPKPAGPYIREILRSVNAAGYEIKFEAFGSVPNLADAAPIPDLELRGYVPAEALGLALSELDVFIALPNAGASGRHTSLTHAFAYGLAVVSTVGRDTDHYLYRHEHNCLLVSTASADNVVAAVIRLCDDAALRLRLGSNAYTTYLEHLSWAAVTQRFRSVLG